ncbi:MAG TPA: lipocalin-like domain-containing protein, partial [Mycobacterium sp.]|nr:lipocalin-like domain-containing protein [Mycobacterium sp.]
MDEPQSADWRVYPFELVPGDPQLSFPAAEANLPDCESDTWFLAGELTSESGRRYAFLAIFNKNRPGQSIVADFYTFALFDLDNGTYGTYTDYDMPPANMQPGARPKMSLADDRLEITYDSGAGTAVWRPCRDDRNGLMPYTYDVTFVGTDPTGAAMRLDLHVTPTRAPVPLGAAAHNGKIECFGQADTYSYFQTSMDMAGTLSWGATEEAVSGSAGHVDRQWFPLIANGGGTDGNVRARSHEWRTINLDNGVDMSIWRQFDRTDGNAPQPFTGVTVSYPDPERAPECEEDVEVTVNSYVRWPDSIRPLV